MRALTPPSSSSRASSANCHRRANIQNSAIDRFSLGYAVIQIGARPSVFQI
jgi:hypothetical protein